VFFVCAAYSAVLAALGASLTFPGPFSVACSSPKMREEIIEGGKVADLVGDEGHGAKRLGPKRDKTTGEFEAVKKGGQGFLKSLRCVIAGDGRVRGEQFAANSSPVK
jgi:hypothetical protein